MISMTYFRLSIMFFLSLLSYMVTLSASVATISFLFFLIGRYIVFFLEEQSSKKGAVFIFDVTFMMSFLYALMSFYFMTAHGYTYLQSIDGINVYIPYTQELLNTTTSLANLIEKIYNTSSYAFVGSILILFVYIGKLSSIMDGELYVTLQLGIILFSSWTAVVVYNLLKYNSISNKKAILYTLLYALLSIHFYMSSLIFRDMPIALFFTLLIYFTFKPYTSKRLIIMIAMVLIIGSIRFSSGIFASIYILLFLFLSLKTAGNFKKTIIFVLFLTSLVVFFQYINIIIKTYELKQMQYKTIQNRAGASTVASFDTLPPGISQIVKVIYNQVMPIPSWRDMVQTGFRPELYNVMNFPIISATLFRYVMFFIILFGLLNKKIRRKVFSNRILVFNLFLAIIFLASQTNAMGHRRLLGVYPIIFLLAVLIYKSLNKRNKQITIIVPIVIFMLLQLIGLSNL